MLALEEKYGNKIAFVIIDTETSDGYELAVQYDVTGIPAFFFLDETGRTVDKMYGHKSGQALREAVERLLP